MRIHSDVLHSPDMNYSITHIGPSALSLFFMQSDSFLSFQWRLEQGRGTSNCHAEREEFALDAPFRARLLSLAGKSSTERQHCRNRSLKHKPQHCDVDD